MYIIFLHNSDTKGIISYKSPQYDILSYHYKMLVLVKISAD